jgi:hypothetical protein
MGLDVLFLHIVSLCPLKEAGLGVFWIRDPERLYCLLRARLPWNWNRQPYTLRLLRGELYLERRCTLTSDELRKYTTQIHISHAN